MSHINYKRSCFRAASLFLVIAAFFIYFEAKAQKNYVQGYVLTKTNDTLTGAIEFKNWETNPRKINFLQTGDHTLKQYTPKDISGFEVNGNSYLSAFLKIDVTPENTENVQEGREGAYIRDSVFLLTLTKGSISLYYLKQFGGKEIFFIKDSLGNINELTRRSYLSNENGITMIRTNDTYKGQLKVYLKKCKEVSDRALRTEYRKSSLIKLLSSYYKCNNETPKLQIKQEPIKVVLGVSGGLNISNLQFTYLGDDISNTPNYIDLASADFKTDYKPFLALSAEIKFPRAWKHWSLYNELNFSKSQFMSSDIKIGFNSLKLLNMIRYTIPVLHNKIYASVGIANGVIRITENSKVVKTLTTSYVTKAMSEYKPQEFSWNAGLGFKLNKKFSCEFRYEKSDGISKYEDLKSVIENYYVVVTFSF